MPALGSHCVLELYECPADVLDDPQRVMDALRAAARAANVTVLHTAEHRFEPQGVTALALLAESHLSIHTWPERGYAACDVFTCGETALPERACDVLRDVLGAKRYEMRLLPRGEDAATRPTRTPAG